MRCDKRIIVSFSSMVIFTNGNTNIKAFCYLYYYYYQCILVNCHEKGEVSLLMVLPPLNLGRPLLVNSQPFSAPTR